MRGAQAGLNIRAWDFLRVWSLDFGGLVRSIVFTRHLAKKDPDCTS